ARARRAERGRCAVTNVQVPVRKRRRCHPDGILLTGAPRGRECSKLQPWHGHYWYTQSPLSTSLTSAFPSVKNQTDSIPADVVLFERHGWGRRTGILAKN